jgi:hypothetical protein
MFFGLLDRAEQIADAEAWGGSMMRLRNCIGPMVNGSKMRDSAGAAGGVVVVMVSPGRWSW